MAWNDDVDASLEGDYLRFEPGERKTVAFVTEFELATSNFKDDEGNAKTCWKADVKDGEDGRTWTVTSYKLMRQLREAFPNGVAGLKARVKRIGKGKDTTWDVEMGT